jgi:hypothetical protein
VPLSVGVHPGKLRSKFRSFQGSIQLVRDSISISELVGLVFCGLGNPNYRSFFSQANKEAELHVLFNLFSFDHSIGKIMTGLHSSACSVFSTHGSLTRTRTRAPQLSIDAFLMLDESHLLSELLLLGVSCHQSTMRSEWSAC